MNDADDIVKEFLVESYENLDRLDRDLVMLEKSPNDREILASVFRTIHTIKGTLSDASARCRRVNLEISALSSRSPSSPLVSMLVSIWRTASTIVSRAVVISHAPENSCRPAVDVLFRSVAQCYGVNVLAVVLTGMGADGTGGSAVIRQAGGQVIVQDEASSVVWGMPGSVVAAQLADQIYPLDGIGSEMVRRVSVRRHLASAVHA
jgi:hypothetical protein